MKILIIGSGGQVGRELAKLISNGNCGIVSLGHSELDISDRSAVNAAIEKHRPTHIINAAAYNAVNLAEKEAERAFAVNAAGPGYIAEAAEEIAAVFVHYSSDYVFDGTKTTDYTEDDIPNPISVYGKSKLMGEEKARICRKHYIIRTAWVFAPGGNNFVSRLAAKMKTDANFSFVNDSWGNPTYAVDIARATLDILEKNLPFGTYHAVGSGACTPFEWASAVAEKTGSRAKITPSLASEYKSAAKRPVRSILSSAKLKSYGITLSNGLERLDDYFSEDVG